VLAACNFRPSVRCTQVWHANGAVKYFGFRDKTIKNRPDSAHKRFKKVYSRFHHITVSSDEMAYIFKEAFGADDSRILKTGVPRTDFFYNMDKIEAEAEVSAVPCLYLKTKKRCSMLLHFVIISLIQIKSNLDIDLMRKKLDGEYHLLLKLHPAVKLSGFNNSEFVTDVSGKYEINSLLAAADVLITDYSSIPFEFSILNKPMIFFPYDLKEYEESRGIWFNYETYMPGPVAYQTADIITALEENDFDLEKIASFNKQWNKYSSGQASEKLIEYIYSM
jgi:Putative glycosyl/glycerophosphate transferases involved in teichoic acid biosynthesis TagF/TagB/EpsJ/RodC